MASIVELFFVLGTIRQATLDKSGEPQQVSVVGIALTYLTATLLSLMTLIWWIYSLSTFDLSNNAWNQREHDVSFYAFIVLASLSTIGVILLSIRLC